MNDYIAHRDRDKLNVIVNKLMDDGWQLHEGLKYINNMYVQQMVKYEPIKKSAKNRPIKKYTTD